MKNSVILKSFSSGISIIMDENIAFEELLQNIALKFQEADSFFKDAAVALSLEGRQLSEQEERQILDVVTQNSRINVLCLMGRDEDKNIRFLSLQNNLSFQKDENYGQFYRGTLKDGQSIETEHSIVVLGDVLEGCSVYSAKDIVILGKLQGEAFAGATGESKHFVVALEMNPQKIKIGDYEYSPKKPNAKWGILKGVLSSPQIAYAVNQEIVMENISSDVLEDFFL